jgi:aerobic C4-dicarboxylate transport protein
MQELTIFAILLVTSKGVATVAGGALIVLAATLSTIDYLPVESIALLLAVDWFLSICRAITNITGNAVATIVVGRWEKAMDETHMHAMLNREKTFDVDTGTVLIYDEATAKNS